MPTFEIKFKQAATFNNQILQPGLSVQISILHNCPLTEIDMICDAFKRVHGIVGMRESGYVGPCWWEAVQIR